MSLHIAAQHLASQGRKGDSTLVHMTPQEVAGLDALARKHYGRGLTTNPSTGLPEAGILAALLPAVAGIALAATGVGAPMAALMVGGGTALATGSIQKGLMAGLGAFGGAGMGDAIAGMGTSAAATAPSAAAQAIGDTAMPAADSAAAFGDAGAGAAGAADAGAFESGFPAAAGSDAGAFESGFPASTAATAPSATTAVSGNYVPFEQGFPDSAGTASVTDQTPSAMGASFDKFRSGIGALGDKGGFDQFIANQGGGMKALSNGALALSPALGQMNKGPGKPPDNAMIRPYSYDPNGQRFTALAPYKASDSNTLFHYAQGGDVGDPRYMQGPGDGVSDSIPATVQSSQGGARPARLGDGEFVVPARIVSEIGNGSSDAGARKLYSMMDRVQQARRRTIGRDGVAVNSGADRMLPA